MSKKYELVKEDSIEIGKYTLYRIKALKDFGGVKKGDLGGYIEKEDNLSHEGNAMVYGNAKVYGNAWVYGNAEIYGNAEVYDNARVYGNTEVYGNTRVYGNAMVYGNAWVFDNVRVYGDARVYDNADISSKDDIITISNIGSRDSTITFFRDKYNIIMVVCGCFKGNIDEFESKVEETHGDNKYGQEYKATIKYVKERFKIREEKNYYGL